MTRIAELQDRLRRLAKRREDEGIYTDAAICEEAAEALSRTGAVKVKALPWKRDSLGRHTATTPFGAETVYEVGFNGPGETPVAYASWYEEEFATVDEAKAAVRADYERRILSALEPAAPEGWTHETDEDGLVHAVPPDGWLARELSALEGQQPVAHVIRKGFSSGVLGWTGYGQKADLPDGTMLYTRPSEQAVTEAMVVAAEEVFFKTDDHGEPSYDMRAALKAAMEARR